MFAQRVHRALKQDNQNMNDQLLLGGDAQRQLCAVMGKCQIKYQITILIKFEVSEILKVLLIKTQSIKLQ